MFILNIIKCILVVFLMLQFLAYFYYEFINFNPIKKSYNELKQELKRKIEDYPGKKINSQSLFIFKYIHKAEKVCEKRSPFLVILVKSKVTNFEQREIIRNTWANQDKDGKIRRIFLLGLPNNNEIKKAEKVKKMIDKESFMYGDIVQKNFYDSYFNNTFQTLMGLEWVSSFCKQVITKRLKSYEQSLNRNLYFFQK